MRLFRSSGHEPHEFACGADFLKSLVSRHYDCLVLDLHMPGQMGIDILREVNSAKFGIPTVIITAHDQADVRQKCLSMGAARYLCKPFDDDVLLQALMEIMQA